MRDRAIEALRAARIGTSVHYIPSHTFSWYRDRPHAPMPVSDGIWQRLMSLPLYPGMLESDVRRVVACLRDAVLYSSGLIH